MKKELIDYDLFGKNLDRILRERKITQIKLGQMAGIKSAVISTYIRGLYSPTITRAQDIASALDIDVRELLKPMEETK